MLAKFTNLANAADDLSQLRNWFIMIGLLDDDTRFLIRVRRVFMKATRTWIVIANGAHARITQNEGPGKGIKAAMNHEFAAPHAPAKAFVADRPGSYPDRGALGTHRFAPKTDRREYEKSLFAADLAVVIDKAAKRKQFDRLVLVAPPTTLGRLRNAMDAKTRGLVAAEVAKDLTHVPLHALPKHLAHVAAL